MITLVLETVGTVAYYSAKAVWWGASWLIYGRQETEEEKILREQREVIQRLQQEIELMHTEIQELHPKLEQKEELTEHMKIVQAFLQDRSQPKVIPKVTVRPPAPTSTSDQT